jgi:predicted nucleotidyltransferase
MIPFVVLIRELRINRKVPLRRVAAFLDIDQAILSKIEHGSRKASRANVLKLAEFFNYDKNELLVAWMSDNLAEQMAGEELATRAFEMAEQKIHYKKATKARLKQLLELLQNYFQNDNRIRKAYIFGSYARGEENPGSDLDLMIEMHDDKPYSLKDLAEIRFNLENLLKIPVDLVEKGFIKPVPWLNVKNEIELIYDSGKSE